MKKLVSLVLVLVMLLSVFVIVPTSAATIDQNKAYVKVNDQYYEVKKGDVFNYVYTLKYTENKISSININISYDTAGLDFVPVYDKYGDVDMMYYFPLIYGGSVFNFATDGKLFFNYSSVSGTRFYEDDLVLFTCDFEVTADTGVYEIGSNLITLADSDLKHAVYEGEVLGEFEAEQTLPLLTPIEITESTEAPSEEEEPVIPTEAETKSVEDPTQDETQEPTISPTEPTEPPSEPLRYNTIYLINSAQWSAPCVYLYTELSEDPNDYIETAPWPGEIMAKTELKAPNGADVYEIVVQDIYEVVVFNDASNYTDDLLVQPGMYYDNKENKWYSDLSEVPTIAPTCEPTEPPTQEDDTDGLFVCADGQLYEVEKGDVFTYTYCLSIDESLKISSLDAHTYYDASGLTFVPVYDKYGDLDVKTMFPILTTGVVYNVESEGKVLYNYSYTSGVRLPDNSEIFKGQFVVTADSGVYEINTKLVTLADSDMNHLVEDSEIIADFGQSSKIEELAPVTPTEVPGEGGGDEQAPTDAPTVLPTQQETEAPTQIKPGSTPGDQEVEPTEAEPTEPVVEPTEPVLEPTEPVVEPTEPVLEPTEPVVEPTEPVLEPTEPEQPTEQKPLPTEPAVNPTEPVELLMGDVNGDGQINIFDVTYIQCYIAEWEKYKVLDERQIIVADTTFDGRINIFDATRIQMYIAEYFTEFTK